jgi:hypothetical protein
MSVNIERKMGSDTTQMSKENQDKKLAQEARPTLVVLRPDFKYG